jgi:uncharacterized protein YcfJ
MNKLTTFAKPLALAALAAGALAVQDQPAPQAPQEQGRVLSATPVTQQVAVPQQVCGNETTVYGPRPTSGAGAVLGAIAGGAAGNAIGGGSGRAAATAIGVIGGAILGNQVEAGNASPGYQTGQRCTTETVYQNQLVGYDVVYEYAGRRYTTRTATDPGGWIALSVQPAVPPAAPPAGYYDDNGYAPQSAAPSVYVQPPPVVLEYGAPLPPPPRHGYWRY